MRCKVVDTKGDTKKLVGGVCCDTFSLYTSIQHSVDQSLLNVSSRLKEMFDREAKSLQQGVHDYFVMQQVVPNSRLSMPLRSLAEP